MAAPLAGFLSESQTAWGKVPPRSRLLLYGILLVLLLWLGSNYFLLPQRAARLQMHLELQSLADSTEALRAQLEALRSEARGEDTMRRSLEEVRRRLKDTLAGLPEGRALSSFLRDLTAPAAGDGIVFVAITPHPLVQRGELLELPFTLVLEGTYPSVTRYLTGLETLPRLISVKSVEISSAAGKPLELRASIAAATYVLGNVP